MLYNKNIFPIDVPLFNYFISSKVFLYKLLSSFTSSKQIQTSWRHSLIFNLKGNNFFKFLFPVSRIKIESSKTHTIRSDLMSCLVINSFITKKNVITAYLIRQMPFVFEYQFFWFLFDHQKKKNIIVNM